uniref:Uncharacterized protein n=1 Tax=Opuntia streptacantha TaxID=393608 RepID=A0A7C8ZFH4_OPUST
MQSHRQLSSPQFTYKHSRIFPFLNGFCTLLILKPYSTNASKDSVCISMPCIHPHSIDLHSCFQTTTCLLKVSLRIIFCFHLDDLTEMINKLQLPSILLIYFIFAGKLDTIVEQLDDLLPIKTRS